MGVSGIAWDYMGLGEIPWDSMRFHGIREDYMGLGGITWD